MKQTKIPKVPIYCSYSSTDKSVEASTEIVFNTLLFKSFKRGSVLKETNLSSKKQHNFSALVTTAACFL